VGKQAFKPRATLFFLDNGPIFQKQLSYYQLYFITFNFLL